MSPRPPAQQRRHFARPPGQPTKAELLRHVPTVRSLVILQELHGRPDWITHASIAAGLVLRGWIEPIGDKWKTTELGSRWAAFRERGLGELIERGTVPEIRAALARAGIVVDVRRTA